VADTPGGSGNSATLTTLPVTNISGTSATSGGNITNDGGSAITQRGIVWSTTPNPTTASSSTNEGSGAGSFTSGLNGLIANTVYYVRAYATNGEGTAYGNQVSFATTNGTEPTNNWLNPDLNYGSVTDQDGNTYATTVIGTQEWMAENLRTTTYANGDPIPNVTDGTQWSNLTTGAWCHYHNDSQYEIPYGKLYNWYTVVDTRNLCPIGWHVPTDAEWSVFINYLDPSADGGSNEFNTAGGKMKGTGIGYWQTPNEDATNESGFSGLPAGLRHDEGSYVSIGYYCYWWSSTEEGPSFSWQRVLVSSSGRADRGYSYKGNGLPIRCFRD
jgi:uncharacterized protein (TIGR02145 family)